MKKQFTKLMAVALFVLLGTEIASATDVLLRFNPKPSSSVASYTFSTSDVMDAIDATTMTGSTSNTVFASPNNARVQLKTIVLELKSTSASAITVWGESSGSTSTRTIYQISVSDTYSGIYTLLDDVTLTGTKITSNITGQPTTPDATNSKSSVTGLNIAKGKFVKISFCTNSSGGATQNINISGFDITPVPPSAPTITSFVAAGVTATISESTTPKTITAVLPYGTDLKTITPTVAIGGTATSYSPSGAQDFSSSAATPVIYSATDGPNTAYYSVSLTANPTPSSAKDLSAVTIGGSTPVFNSTTSTYSVILPKAASLTQAVSFTNPTTATADFTSGSTFNFSSPLTITVTAQDNSTKAYTLQAVNGIADIAYVTVDGNVGTTDTQVYPDLVSKGYFVQLINAASGSDITRFNNYDVTILTESPSSSNALALAMSGLIGVKPFLSMKSFLYGKTGWPTGGGANGSADLGANVLSCYLNHPIFNGVTFSGNTASILTSGITGNGIQGVTTPGSGTIVANLPSLATAASIIEQNSVPAAKYLLIPISTTNYNVVNASGLKLIENSISYLLGSSVYTLPSLEISSFTVNSVAATIDNTAGTITAQLPISTDITALQPAIVLTGASTTVSPLSGVATDFSNSYTTPVNYTVTDGCNTKVYAVTISVNATGLSPNTLSHVYFDGKVIHNDAKWDLQVFDTTGRLLVRSTKDINMISNAKGVYIVKSNSGTLKIVL